MNETLGQRCVNWCISHLGVKEEPAGSNDGPLIRKWLMGCIRGYGASSMKLGAIKTNWCAAFQGAAVMAVLEHHDKIPHEWRAGVVEMVQDTSPGKDGRTPFAGVYKPIRFVHDGSFVPCSGDLAIYDRSVPGKPETSWFRHVNRVVEFRNGGFTTVGGNEGDRVKTGTHSIIQPNLLGFIHYPQDVPAEWMSDKERKEIGNNVEMFLWEMRNKLHSTEGKK